MFWRAGGHRRQSLTWRIARVLRWVVLTAGLAALCCVSAASAGPTCTATVSTYTALNAAFQTSNTVCLSGSITEDVGGENPGEDLAVGDSANSFDASVTLDLEGYTLTITDTDFDEAGIYVGPSSTLTIEDSVGGGALNVTGQGNAAGIGGNGSGPNEGGPSAGTVVIDSGDVTATGGDYSGGGGPGIGTGTNGSGGTMTAVTIAGGTVDATGGLGASGIGGGVGAGDSASVGGTLTTFTMTGGTVTATGGGLGSGVGGGGSNGVGGAGGTVSITGGSLDATGGSNGSAIGGGYGGTARGAGSSLTIGAGGTVTVSGEPINNQAGVNANEAGSVSNAGMLTIASSSGLNPTSGLTYTNSGTILLSGSIGGDGTIDNTGVIEVQSGGSVAGNGDGDGTSSLLVEPNNYTLSFADNGGSGGPPATLHVYANNILASGQTLPPEPTAPAGAIFQGWFSAATGGEQLSNTTVLADLYGSGPAEKTLYAGFLVVASDPQNTTVTALQDATLSASVTSAVATSVQWQSCSGACTTFTDISGATSTTLTLSNVPESQNGDEYRAVFTDGEGESVTTAPATLTVNPISQSIGFTAPATPVSPGTSASLSATGGGSDQPVEFTVDGSSTPGACTVTQSGSGAGTVQYVHHGTCVIDANQAASANGDYTAAPTVSQSVTIGVIAQAISLSPLPGSASADSTATLSATGGGSGQPVTFSVGSSSSPANVCSETQSGSGAGTVTFAHAGTCVIDANQAGTTNGDYAAAPTVSQTVTVSTSAVTVSLPAPPSTVYGQAVTVTASEVAADGTDPAGSIQFAVDGQTLGASVSVSAGGTATSPSLLSDGALAPGSHTVTATFTSADGATYGSGSASATQVVDQASTTTALRVTAKAITATVAAVSPGAGSPSGSVTFDVDGQSVGTAPVSGGTATLNDAVPSGKAAQVSASYSGDADFTGSSASTSRENPTITARVSSASKETRFGWYRTPVRVSFSCQTDGAPLIGSCPAAVTLSKSAAAQSVTRTIAATDGGMATVVVKGIDIDRVKPTVGISGAKAGAALDGGVPTLRCAGHDALSGVASCTVKVTRRSSDTGLDLTTVHATATATDKAGNRSTHTIAFTTLGIYLENASESKGLFTVTGGRTYEIVVTGAARPRYIDAGPAPVRPSGQDRLFYPAGHDRWVLGVTLPPRFFAQFAKWYLGVEINAKLHSVPVRRAG